MYLWFFIDTNIYESTCSFISADQFLWESQSHRGKKIFQGNKTVFSFMGWCSFLQIVPIKYFNSNLNEAAQR